MGRTGQKTILLVEDEALIAMYEARQLEGEGYRVITASRGEKAVAIVSDEGTEIDLVLMDIDLGPGMDGTEAAVEILRRRDVPLVFLSSHTEKEIVRKTEVITNYGYVVKDSSFTVLDASIKMAFKLFEARKSILDQKMEIEVAYEEMQVTNEELVTTQEGLIEQGKALDQSEAVFRSLFEKGPIGTAYHRMVYDGSGKPVDYIILDANRSYEELTGSAAPCGKRVTEAFPGIEDDPFDWIGRYGEVAKHGKDIRFQQYFRLTDRWYDIVAYQNKPDHFVTAFFDITDRKRAEEKVERLLREKELLLKEIHHRVKNNLGLISSLLQVQAEAVEATEAKKALVEASGRVTSLGMLYDRLYRSETMGSVSMAAYIPALVRDIASSYPSRATVSVETRVDDIAVGAKTLSSLGIIVNELMTNAMKYAFAGRDGGRIAVAASEAGGLVRVVFEDDGVGLPESFEAGDPAGFGMRLVAALVDQIDGTLAVGREGGARFVIEFKP
ncbi:MAG: response regulator [Spirochaetes bacterium]|nr:response regulator [Spirochaetota bacterium]MBU1080366.1 response regulator [Spirochaetota bacterium]